jgi:hypothetical protein
MRILMKKLSYVKKIIIKYLKKIKMRIYKMFKIPIFQKLFIFKKILKDFYRIKKIKKKLRKKKLKNKTF